MYNYHTDDGNDHTKQRWLSIYNEYQILRDLYKDDSWYVFAKKFLETQQMTKYNFNKIIELFQKYIVPQYINYNMFSVNHNDIFFSTLPIDNIKWIVVWIMETQFWTDEYNNKTYKAMRQENKEEQDESINSSLSSSSTIVTISPQFLYSFDYTTSTFQ